jgi:virginiamycin B lyase
LSLSKKRNILQNVRSVAGLLLIVAALGLLLIPARSAVNLPQYITEYSVPTPASAPLAITVDWNGVVWFTESNASKLARFDPGTDTFLEYTVPGVGDMWGITVDQNGHIWFTQYSGRGSVNPGGQIVPGGNGRLGRFDPTTQNFTFVNVLGVGSFPMRITTDQQNRIWFTEFLGNKIGMYDQNSGELSEYRVPTNESGPADLTFDSNGTLWFTEAYARQIGEFNPVTHHLTEIPLGSETPSQIVSSPVGIAVDQEGNVWCADHGGNWIVEFEPNGNKTVRYPTHFPPPDVYPISIPNGLLIDREGRVWFTEHGGNSIGYLNATGQTMVEFPIPTGPVSTALWIALAPNGNVWFTEWSTNKIGVVHANLPIPVSISASICPFHYPVVCQLTFPDYVHILQKVLKLSPGGHGMATALVKISQNLAGNGTLLYSWASYNPQDLSATYSSPYPPLTGPAEAAISVHITVSDRAFPGSYMMGLGINAGAVLVWALIPAVVD